MGNPYTIQLSDEERELYDSFAQKHGYTTLSRLIRQALEVVIRTPSLLEPTESFDITKLTEAIEKAGQATIQEQIPFFQGLEDRLFKVERLMEALALQAGMSKKDIKKAQKKDDSSEAVFD